MLACIVLLAVAAVVIEGAPSQVVPVVPVVASAVSAQHHAQDELGQYNYGYTNPLSAKEETKTLDGITRGGYSYRDAHGLVQSVNYVSDDVNGFRVAATNLPAGPVAPAAPVEDEPIVAQAKAIVANEVARPIVVAPLPEVASVVAEPTPVVKPLVVVAPVVAEQPPLVKTVPAVPLASEVPAPEPAVFVPPSPPVVAAPEVIVAPPAVVPPQVVPVPVAAAPPAVVSAPVIASAVTAQHHAQDELGQYSYGYVNPLSAKEEVKTADGITRGGYSYLDSHGLVQNVNYVSDDVNGFRVAASNIPQQVAPVDIPDSPEVAAAKAKFFTAIDQAKAAVQHSA